MYSFIPSFILAFIHALCIFYFIDISIERTIRYFGGNTTRKTTKDKQHVQHNYYIEITQNIFFKNFAIFMISFIFVNTFLNKNNNRV